MKLFSLIIIGLVIFMLIGTAFRYQFDKLTMAKDWDISTQPGWFVILYILFSPIMFLLYKPIREFRKIHYMKCKVRHYEFWTLAHQFTDYKKENEYSDYIKYKRYLKLKTIQRKSKRNVFTGNLHRILTK